MRASLLMRVDEELDEGLDEGLGKHQRLCVPIRTFGAPLCAYPDVWRPLRFRISTQELALFPDTHTRINRDSG